MVGYDRYRTLKKGDGTVEPMPFVKIPESPSDKYITWNPRFDRLDVIADKYYGNPFYDFLIYYSNPEFLCFFDVPDNATIRIPFPLSTAKVEYERLVEKKITS